MRKLSCIATAVCTVALIVSPATAFADCGDPGQDPCTGPVPTVDQIAAIMAELTDPNKPAASKTDIVTPGFSPDEAATIDDHLHRMDGYSLPINFIITNIQPAPNNFAGATMAATGGYYQRSPPGTIALVDQNGHWLLTHGSAKSWLDAIWHNADRRFVSGNSL
jgi:hypothetical protein